ncbi:MAG TPA: hypothetical protein VG326_18925 [Tepidisphaeraceae bacterium]|jgi:hypothetical protein|nr:hypothetical protein [Tepidisphaeraceae bacterium]
MLHFKSLVKPLFIVVLSLAALAPFVERAMSGAPSRERTPKELERDRWENLVLFYGDEETGEWSLRIDDKSVSQRAWFEWLELWQFDANDGAWHPVKTDKFAKPIVLPKQKGTDQPEGNQVLVKLEEIPPQTAGLWYAKWRVDGTDCGTVMRVGTNRTSNHVQIQAPPPGMLKMAVPLTLEKAVGMIIPDPRVYCITGGPGKPVAGATTNPAKSEVEK